MNTYKPKITIVTTTYNLIHAKRRDTFLRCVESVRNQSYKNIEHLIIDGASTDGTLELIESTGLKFYSEPDNGIYDAMNKSIEKANGEYITFLNSDDFYYNSNGIEHSIDALLYADADYCYSDAQRVDNDKILTPFVGTEKFIIFGTYYCHQTQIVKTDVMKELSGFSVNHIAADNNFMMKLIAHDKKGVFVPTSYVSFDVSGFSSNLDPMAPLSAHVRDFYSLFGKKYDFSLVDCKNLLNFHFIDNKEYRAKILEKISNEQWKEAIQEKISSGQSSQLLDFAYMPTSLKKPLLFITFNRLDTTQKVFEQIAIAKPPRLYLASDGARPNKQKEKKTVEEIRNWLLENINWDCEVKTKFNEENMGCGKGVSSAITWFFEHEEDGIILEDDTVPHQSFFKFCEEMLNRYKDDKRVWHIAGDNALKELPIEESYFFFPLMLCWGWASWRDKWSKHYQFSLKGYDKKNFYNLSDDKEIHAYFEKTLITMQSNKPIDTWDYQWAMKILEHKGLCVVPSKNLICNIGFDGAHYSNAQNDPRLNLATFNIYDGGDLVHPEIVEKNKKLSEALLTKIIILPPQRQSQPQPQYSLPVGLKSISYRLFNLIPLFKIIYTDDTATYCLFNKIPIWVVKKRY